MKREKMSAGRKMVALPPELWTQVDDFRFSHRFKSESEALRKLIEKGLEAASAEGKTEGGAQA